VDNRLRRNEICVIGLPRCDFVFASSRSCFIAYGFGTSDLEMTILRGLLEKKGIEPLEAGGMRAPGMNAFCVKICSKIITSQFCIVLLNNDVHGGVEVPNANVNMEYGLMLGFNKYVIPFQRAEQKLPFNVAALDTIKYTNETFAADAAKAIEQALTATTPTSTPIVDLNQKLQTFILLKEASVARVETEGDKAVYDLGSQLGFNLLMSFAGTDYTFLGNFTHLRPEAVLWRVRMLYRAIDGRRSSWGARVDAGLMKLAQVGLYDQLFSKFQVWLIVNSDQDRDVVNTALATERPKYKTQVFSLSDVDRELATLGGALA
jgi:hypothetical protein